jgi:hypothetical protein
MKPGILVAGMLVGIAVFAADTGAELFQKAVTQERAAGNLEEAIRLYQRVAHDYAKDRALTAKALVAEARCYEKLGQDKAVKLYEQVARDFADQPAAKEAGVRLAALRQGSSGPASTGTTQRKFDLPVPLTGTETARLTDGQRVVYIDEASGFLTISDVSGASRRVFLRPKGVAEFLTPTRDLSMVYFQLRRPDGSRVTAVVGTDGSGYRELGNGNSCGATWSWDNRFLVVCQPNPPGTQSLLKISMDGGQAQKLTPTGIHAIRVSPDGRFLAYSVWENQFQQIFVAPVDGGEPQLVSDRARIMDWTRDGRYLIAAMDVSGSEALYLLPIREGKKSGEPVLVHYGSFGKGHVTPSGAFVYNVPAQRGGYETWLGALDPQGRPSDWKPLALENNSANPNPTWSPDSRRIAYSAANLAAGQTTQTIRVRDLASGEDRELYRAGTGTVGCVWAAQHPNLFCAERAAGNRAQILSIAVGSGRAERLGSLDDSTWTTGARSSDDRAIYLMSPGHLIRWDIAAHQSIAVEDSPGFIPPSPDERWIVRRHNGTIEIRPLAGGKWKALGPIAPDGDVYRLAGFTPDGKWLLYQNFDGAGKRSFFRVATEGNAAPERVGDLPGRGASLVLSISPDGRTVIAASRRPDEMWILENFEPGQQR